MTRFAFVGIFLIVSLGAVAQEDNTGSGRAVSFDGSSDYINMGNVYDDLVLPVTVSAWINLSSAASTAPIFASQDNLDLYDGFTFLVTTTVIGIGYGDGQGSNNPAFRRGKSATVPDITGRWVHVAAVMRAATDMDIFLNGVNVGGDYSGSSDLPMAARPEDFAKIGHIFSNGIASWFQGSMDEVCLWNRSLSQAEIQSNMCHRLIGNEIGLIGYWTFNETSGSTTIDASPNGFNGNFQGNPARHFSGAPIGDRSVALYSSNFAGQVPSISDGTHNLTVSNIMGSPAGVQLYEVNSVPSQTGGLDLTQSNKPYFGVYLAGMGSPNSFDANYRDNGMEVCKIFSRTDNSIPDWATATQDPLQNVAQRGEFISGDGPLMPLNLGPDKVLCDSVSTKISAGATQPGTSFIWSTGAMTPEIVVTQSGLYIVTRSNGCTVLSDSVMITFARLPPSISLGGSEMTCAFKPRMLTPTADTTGLNFLWQDGSHKPSLNANDFGTYWVKVSNACGTLVDTVKFEKLTVSLGFVPNVITPNGDGLNETFKVQTSPQGLITLLVINRWGKEVYYSEDYQNNWTGDALPAGIYYVLLSGPCIAKFKNPLVIVR